MNNKFINFIKTGAEKSFLLLLFFAVNNSLHAQPFYKFIDTIEVANGKHKLQFPFCGGMNNPQFSVININQDTFPDLFVFDRSGNKPMVFINKGIKDSVAYQYFPEAESWFPAELSLYNINSYVLIRDMNCDGEGDIILVSGPYVKIFLAHRNADGSLTYTLKNFYQKGVGYVPYVTYFIPGGTSGNMDGNAVDISAVDDIDGDGDLDILSFNLSSEIWMYKNLQIEDGVGCSDSIRFQNTSWCWGKIQDNYIREVTLGTTCPIPRRGSAKHSGNTLATFDIDNDGDKDLIKGNISWSSLSALYNNRQNGVDSIFAQDTLFPANNYSYRTDQFAAPFLVDVNNDKWQDLLVSPNAQYFSENRKCVSLYKHSGIPSLQPFKFVSDSFLVSEMMDVGEGNYPTFIDFNNDSLPDLVMSSNGIYDSVNKNFVAQLFLYKNNGTKNHAKLQLQSVDWMKLSTLHQRMLAPAFGDLNGDNLPDLICGTDSGKLFYFQNTGTKSAWQFSLVSPFYQNIFDDNNSTPQLIDLNNDGLLDLVFGKRNGKISYYQNTGTTNNAAFTKISDSLGKVNVQEYGDMYGFSVPYFFKFSPTAPLSLLVGNKYGHVFQYENISNNLLGNFSLRSNNFSNIKCGERAAPTSAQLIGNDSVEVLCGTYRGGVQLYTDGGFGVPNAVNNLQNETEKLIVFPNPTKQSLAIIHQSLVNAIQVYNVLGQCCISLNTKYQALSSIIDVSILQNGIYFLKATDEKGFQHIAKFIKE